jgi:hypothetical protein
VRFRARRGNVGLGAEGWLGAEARVFMAKKDSVRVRGIHEFGPAPSVDGMNESAGVDVQPADLHLQCGFGSVATAGEAGAMLP